MKGAKTKKLFLLILFAMIVATVIIDVIIFLRISRLPFVQVTILGATHSLTHWIGWGGALYIAFTSPFLPIIKRKTPRRFKAALQIHMIGNMLAVLLISVHFAHQLTRPAFSYPDLGTGVALYAATVLLVATGIILYSGKAKQYTKYMRFLHPAFAVTFYTIAIVHILQGISVI
ncbi:MAG: hypothetical protein NWF00_05840 [Candidatus Bathyarchaeota archaeon]|nr:hypothetical protein [Candidatus Bathyarchaeota archaeon]